MMTRYNAARDFPALKGPSYLSRHLRFGTRRFAVRSEQLAMQCAAALAQTVPWHGYRNWSGISIWQPIMAVGNGQHLRDVRSIFSGNAPSCCSADFLPVSAMKRSGYSLSSFQTYFNLCQDLSGLPSTVPGLNLHRLRACHAASSSLSYPLDDSILL